MDYPDKEAYGKYLCLIVDQFDESILEERELYWDCFYCPVPRSCYDTFQDYQGSCVFHKNTAWCYLEENGYLVMLPGNLEIIEWKAILAVDLAFRK